MDKQTADIVFKKLDILEKKIERYYKILKIYNELDFILNGTYVLENEINNILNGNY